MDLNWVRNIRDWCAWAEVPLFVKQLGTFWAQENLADDWAGGNVDEWPEDLKIRLLPPAAEVKELASPQVLL